MLDELAPAGTGGLSVFREQRARKVAHWHFAATPGRQCKRSRFCELPVGGARPARARSRSPSLRHDDTTLHQDIRSLRASVFKTLAMNQQQSIMTALEALAVEASALWGDMTTTTRRYHPGCSAVADKSHVSFCAVTLQVGAKGVVMPGNLDPQHACRKLAATTVADLLSSHARERQELASFKCPTCGSDAVRGCSSSRCPERVLTSTPPPSPPAHRAVVMCQANAVEQIKRKFAKLPGTLAVYLQRLVHVPPQLVKNMLAYGAHGLVAFGCGLPRLVTR